MRGPSPEKMVKKTPEKKAGLENKEWEPSEALKAELDKFNINAEAVIEDLKDPKTPEELKEDKLQSYLDKLQILATVIGGAAGVSMAADHGVTAPAVIGAAGFFGAGMAFQLASVIRTFDRMMQSRANKKKNNPDA